MSAYGGTCVFVALLGDGKCMMMSANGDDSVCFPCLSKCECPRPVFCSFILSYLFLWGLER